jgi:hypothetical protein
MVSTLTTSQLVKYIKGPSGTFVQVRQRVGFLFLLLPPHSTITTCSFQWIRTTLFGQYQTKLLNNINKTPGT